MHTKTFSTTFKNGFNPVCGSIPRLCELFSIIPFTHPNIFLNDSKSKFFFVQDCYCCCISISLRKESNKNTVQKLSHSIPSSIFRVPNVLAEFETKYLDEQGNILDTRTYNVDLNSGMKTLMY